MTSVPHAALGEYGWLKLAHVCRAAVFQRSSPVSSARYTKSETAWPCAIADHHGAFSVRPTYVHGNVYGNHHASPRCSRICVRRSPCRTARSSQSGFPVRRYSRMAEMPYCA